MGHSVVLQREKFTDGPSVVLQRERFTDGCSTRMQKSMNMVMCVPLLGFPLALGRPVEPALTYTSFPKSSCTTSRSGPIRTFPPAWTSSTRHCGRPAPGASSLIAPTRSRDTPCHPRDAPWHPGRQAQPAAGTRLLRGSSAQSQEAGNKKGSSTSTRLGGSRRPWMVPCAGGASCVLPLPLPLRT